MISIFDKKLRGSFINIAFGIMAIVSLVLAICDLNSQEKYIIGCVILFLLIALYGFMWWCASKLTERIIYINKTKVIIKFGDIFTQPDLKVIPFNEYFDTKVDDIVISNVSLNGKFLQKVGTKEFLKKFNKDPYVKKSKSSNKKYMLGTIFKYEDYCATAFARFDKDNKAYINIHDYIFFLINFWKELDRVYAHRNVSIPLIGGGITRFMECDVSKQELLKLIIWSLKMSRIIFEPAELTVIIHNTVRKEINLYELNDNYSF
jgi:hypothetical protein